LGLLLRTDSRENYVALAKGERLEKHLSKP